jgi:hypothetical protein
MTKPKSDRPELADLFRTTRRVPAYLAQDENERNG